MRDFVEWMEMRGYAEGTIRHYTNQLERCARWLDDHGRPPMPRCSWRDLRQYAAQELPNTYASRQQLRSALTVLWRSIEAGEAPSWAVECPKKPRGHYRGLNTKEDLERFLAAARTFGARQYVAACALYYQGLRREEAARMRWEDLRDGGLRGVGKGSQEFELPVHPRFAESLQLIEPRGPWILEGRWPGTHVSPATIWSWTRLAGERAGLGRITPHQLRHTSIATIHDETGNLRTAAEFARHADPKVTMRYTRTARAALAKGMAAL